jgi:hypothetical protein
MPAADGGGGQDIGLLGLLVLTYTRVTLGVWGVGLSFGRDCNLAGGGYLRLGMCV